MKEDKMGVACGTYGEHVNAYRVFVGKTEAMTYA
jgi:hypothetical protein